MQKNSFYQDARLWTIAEHIMLLWNIFQWLNEYISSRSFTTNVWWEWASLATEGPAFMLWLLPYKVGIFVESLGQFLSGEELWITIFAPLPLGTWRWKEQELLRYSFELKQPNLSNLWAGQDWGDVCAGLEPWFHIQGSHLSFVCQSLKLKSRCPAVTNRHQFSGLKTFR